MKKIDKNNIENIFTLSPMQEGMLFHYLREPESELYFEQLSLGIKGDIDLRLFEEAWHFIVQTNEMLRTVFRWEKLKKPVQIVFKKRKITINYYDISNENNEIKDKLIEEMKTKDKKEKFDLNDVPFRITLYKVHNQMYEMIISNHHILYDGWGTGIILKEFLTAYAELSNNRELIPPQKNSYKEYVKYLQNQDKDRGKLYWEEYLRNYENKAIFSNKRKNGTVNHYSFKFSEAFIEKLNSFTQKHKITLATLLYSAWGILLQKYSNSNDAVFGTTVSGRNIDIHGIESMVGLFINTVPLRVTTNKKDNALELIYKIDKNLQKRRDYETISLVDLKSYCRIDNRENLFNTAVVIENYPLDNILFGENKLLDIIAYSIYEQTNFDLVMAVEEADTMKITFSYKNNIFSEEMIKKILGHFCKIISELLDKPHILVEKIDMLTEKEKREIIYDFNDTKTKYSNEKTIQDLFEEQVEETPNNIALIFKEEKLTYKEVNKRANSLARVLRKKGVKSDIKVGIMVKRSIEMIVGILAVLKAGGAYLPIDYTYPKNRIKYLLEDSDANILLVQDNSIRKIDFKGETINLNDKKLYKEENTNLEKVNKPTDLAYLIYTSGTTGKPKGVMIEHQGVVNYVCWANKNYLKGNNETFPLFSSISFDLTVTSIFTPLISGGKVVIYENKKDELILYRVLKDNKATIIKLTPAHLILIKGLTNEESSIKRIIVGGENLPSQLAKEVIESFGGEVEIFNEYGPTEATVGCMIHKYNPKKDDENSVPIGKPADNIQIYILDKSLNPVANNIVGELYISGVGLARGYLNRPVLTKEKFIQHPFIKGERIYKTGDLARWDSDGNIEFLGRIDNQVKLRGYRIELNEIENTLLKQEYIKEAAVIAKKDKNDDKYICAYIVADRDLSQYQLKEHLNNYLPEYMIPSYFVKLEKMPLTLNGKIDRKRLPKLDGDIQRSKEYEAPRDETEEILLRIWQEVLSNKKRIGIDDNFFEIGGHSIKAMQIIGQMNKTFDIDIEINELFKNPTIRKLANHILNAQKGQFKEIEKAFEKEYYELSYNQRKLWTIYKMEPENTAYNMTGKIILRHSVNKEALKRALEKIVSRHESLRTGFNIINNKPVQFIEADTDTDINLIETDLSFYNEKTKDYERQLVFEKEKEFIFDISKSHLFRATLVKLDEGSYELLFNMHHIISDGWSIGILKKEFLKLYGGYRNDLKPELSPVKIQYKDFALWHNKLIKDDFIKAQAHQYWKNIFKKGIKEISLPYRHSTNNEDNISSGYVCMLNNEVKDKIKELSINNNITLFAAMFSAFNLLISKFSDQREILCGIPSAGRTHISTHNTVGFFVNSMILISNIDYNESFSDLINKINTNLLNVFKYQYYPLELVFQELKMRYPDIPIFFNMLNLPVGNTEEELDSFKSYHVERVQNAKFNMVIYLTEYKNGIEIACNYKKALLKGSTIEFMMKEYIRIIEYFAFNPGKSFDDYNKLGKKRIV